MAGIGFELKKLYEKKGLFAQVKGHFFSIFVTIGPLLISVLLIVSIQALLRNAGVSRADIDLIQATIMYSFIGSIIMTSGYSMLLSRYLSDQLYQEKTENILSAFYGSISLMVVFLGIAGIIFYMNSPLDLPFKVLSYMLYLNLGLEIVISVFISAIKDFRKVANSFVFGTFMGFVFGYVLFAYSGLDQTISTLISMNVGLVFINVSLFYEVKKYFNVVNHRFFSFVGYFEDVSNIFFTNMFYISTIYIHNFVVWAMSDITITVGETFTFAPLYDVPDSFAFLSLTPTLVMFVVKIETVFFDKYRNLFYLVNKNASYDDIIYAKKELISTTNKEIIYMMEVQLFFTLAFIIAGPIVLPLLGFTSIMISTYITQVLGYYTVIISFVIMTLMLYYDYQSGAVAVAITLFGAVFALSVLQNIWFPQFYGLGFLLGGIIGLVTAILLLYHYLNELEYRIFCDQVVWVNPGDGWLKKAIKNIEGD